MNPSTLAKAGTSMALTLCGTSTLIKAKSLKAVAGTLPRRGNPLPAKLLGWRRAFEQHRQIEPETLLNVALGNFQYLTVT